MGVSLNEMIRLDRRSSVKSLLNRMTNDSRLIGVSVCSPRGTLVNKSDTVPKQIACNPEIADTDDRLTLYQGTAIHVSSHKLRAPDGETLAVLNVFQNSSHLRVRAEATQRYIIFAFIGIGLLVSLVTMAVYRWTVAGPLDQLTRTLKFIAAGRTKFAKSFENTDLGPFVRNLEKVLRDLRQSKPLPAPSTTGLMTAARLREVTQRLFGEAKFCVVANREPYIHNRKGSKIEVQFPSSGLVSAVEPILRACSGVWIGHGSGSADRETADGNGIILVPPGNPEYALKRVWLSKEEEQGYYFGFANEGLWPLCHIAHTRPIFRNEDWEQYQKVNKKFADAFNEQVNGAKTIALIQDYHFALLPGILRQSRPDTVSSLFWHIPWPNPEAIAICPWKNQIMAGMLGADLIGFHTQYHCNNFLDSVDRFMEARVDRENFSVTIRGHTCYVKPFPISIEWPPRNDARPDEIPEIRAKLLEELGLPKDIMVGVGIDRLDYTKGIIERFLSIERLLEKYPQYVGKFVFIQIGAPSRTQIKRYQDFNSEVQEVTNRINWRFGQNGYEPIHLRLNHHDAAEVFRYYRASKLCYVSSLHDGMNLVAKEFIAARSDEQGVLVLSSFTGAAKELTDALIINPYDIEENADALHAALKMSPEEQRLRMQRLRQVVSTNNVYNWAA
ncbi:MAG TPA: trehalose-6-phosphate synthase, partial [Bdellovibrionales bacterium]|nr:trehalose-6-phosphate synthase [Bdellovibrionales bacterium]